MSDCVNIIKEQTEKRTYSSTVLVTLLDEDSSQIILDLSGILIPKEHWYYEQALLYQPHMTIVRNIIPSQVASLQTQLDQNNSLHLATGAITVLDCGDNPYNVVTLEINCPDAVELNSRLTDVLTITEDFAYRPHITLGFIQPEYAYHYQELPLSAVSLETAGFAIFDEQGRLARVEKC